MEEKTYFLLRITDEKGNVLEQIKTSKAPIVEYHTEKRLLETKIGVAVIPIEGAVICGTWKFEQEIGEEL